MRRNFDQVKSATRARQVLVLRLTHGYVQSMPKLMEDSLDLLKVQVLQLFSRQVANHIADSSLSSQRRRSSLCQCRDVLNLLESLLVLTRLIPLEQVEDDVTTVFNL